VKNVNRSISPQLAGWVGLVCVGIGAFVLAFMFTSLTTMRAVDHPAPLVFGVMMLVSGATFLYWSWLSRLLKNQQLKHSSSRGVPYDHQAEWRRTAKLQKRVGVAIVLAVVVLLIMAVVTPKWKPKPGDEYCTCNVYKNGKYVSSFYVKPGQTCGSAGWGDKPCEHPAIWR
jgi:ascorbate-specific PTS system EIIC-type component UlaA